MKQWNSFVEGTYFPVLMEQRGKFWESQSKEGSSHIKWNIMYIFCASTIFSYSKLLVLCTLMLHSLTCLPKKYYISFLFININASWDLYKQFLKSKHVKVHTKIPLGGGGDSIFDIYVLITHHWWSLSSTICKCKCILS